MSSSVSARTALRAGTAEYHDRVDHAFSGADLSRRAGYAEFLQAQAPPHILVETALTRDGAAKVVPDWPERRRQALIEADLAALGVAIPEAKGNIAFASPAALLGGIYVLEGSRLGGAMLRRMVPDNLPRAFLGARYPGGWPRFLAVLDERLPGENDRQIAIKAAQEVFVLFERAAQRFSKVQHVGG